MAVVAVVNMLELSATFTRAISILPFGALWCKLVAQCGRKVLPGFCHSNQEEVSTLLS